MVAVSRMSINKRQIRLIALSVCIWDDAGKEIEGYPIVANLTLQLWEGKIQEGECTSK